MKQRKWEAENLGSSLDLEELKALIKKAEDNNWDSFYLGIYHHGYDGADLESNYSRLETDEEYETRLAEEAANTKKKQATLMKKREKDRAMYEKLKAQFEGEK